MLVGLLGLGEAGSLIAGDLAASGVDVQAYDPADVPTPPGVQRHSEPRMAVVGASLVMAVTAAADAQTALHHVAESMDTGALYADLATSSPSAKQRLARLASDSGVEFADVALMAPVPGRGLSTPSLASGSGAGRYAKTIERLGGRVEVVDGPAGAAAARKLMRSVVTKGLAALIIEAMETAGSQGETGWMWEHVTELLTSIDHVFLDRLMTGTSRHAVRRLEEVEIVAEYLDELGVAPHMTRATAERLRPFTVGDAGSEA